VTGKPGDVPQGYTPYGCLDSNRHPFQVFSAPPRRCGLGRDGDGNLLDLPGTSPGRA
jgi:hypothetical protein